MTTNKDDRLRNEARELYALEVFARVADGWTFPRKAVKEVNDVAERFCATKVQLTVTNSELISLYDAVFASAVALRRAAWSSLDDEGDDATTDDLTRLAVILELTSLASRVDEMVRAQSHMVDVLAVSVGGRREHTDLQ